MWADHRFIDTLVPLARSVTPQPRDRPDQTEIRISASPLRQSPITPT